MATENNFYSESKRMLSRNLQSRENRDRRRKRLENENKDVL